MNYALLCKVAATGCIHRGERYTKSKDTELHKISYIKDLYLSNTIWYTNGKFNTYL